MRKISKKYQKLLLIVAIVIAFLGVGSIVAARQYYYRNLEPVSGSQRDIVVTIEKGSTVSQIAELLHEKGLIRNPAVFAQYVRNNGAQDQLQAGTYSLRPSYSVGEIVTILTHGAVQKNLFTILPGQRIDQIRQSLIDAGYSKADVDEALDPANYKDHPALVDKPAKANLEGYLYPESFQRTAETSASTIITQSLDEMHQNLTPDMRAGIARQGLTVYEGITLASIIEQEVSNPSDRAKVAQVFLKRYKMGMQLGSDVTAFYGAILQKGPSAGNNAAIDLDTPYNTRMHEGLPPGPISNISASSINAVVNPANTDWLYFVAGDDGTTHFAKTNAEHEENVARYCTTLCGR